MKVQLLYFVLKKNVDHFQFFFSKIIQCESQIKSQIKKNSKTKLN